MASPITPPSTKSFHSSSCKVVEVVQVVQVVEGEGVPSKEGGGLAGDEWEIGATSRSRLEDGVENLFEGVGRQCGDPLA